MFAHLNIQTRRAVGKLCGGEIITLGDQTVGPISEESRKLLALLAEHMIDLQERTGAALVEKVLELQKEFKFEPGSGAFEGNSDERTGASQKKCPCVQKCHL
ncbi:MAG: hypothetical protein ACYTEK_23065 [Planctomycetota bacterium]|jgi:hypothetical protein